MLMCVWMVAGFIVLGFNLKRKKCFELCNSPGFTCVLVLE